MSYRIGELEPVHHFPGGGGRSAIAQSGLKLRPGTHIAALDASRYAVGWCRECGRRRGADGRCPVCDPWWMSSIYAYGSLLTLGVTALLLTILPLLRPNYNLPSAARPPMVALLAPPAMNVVNQPIPPVAPPTVPVYRIASVSPVISHIIDVPPPSGPNAAALADIARLRAITDYAAVVENRQAAARAWSGGPPPTMVPLPGAVIRVPPPVIMAAPNASTNGVDETARDADAARTL